MTALGGHVRWQWGARPAARGRGAAVLKGKQDNYYLLQPLTTAIEHEGLPIKTPHALCLSFSLGPLWAQTYLANEKTRTYPLGRLREASPYWDEVARSVGVADQTVRRALVEHGMAIRPGGRRKALAA